MRRLLLLLGLCGGLAPGGVLAVCDPGVGAGVTDARSGLQKINYQRCHFEVEYNANIDKHVANGGRNVGCVVLLGVTASNQDDREILIAGFHVTKSRLVRAWCHCRGTCTAATATFAFKDRAGNAISLTGGSDLACGSGTSTDTATTFNTSDSDRDLVPGEGLRIAVTNTPASTDEITLCVELEDWF